MKKNFFAGLIIFLPIAITIWLFVFFLDLFTAPFIGIIHESVGKLSQNTKHLQEHKGLLLFLSRILVAVLMMIFIVIIGFLAQRFFFSYLIKTLDRLLNRIPIVKRIYRVLVDITKGIFSSNKKNYFQGSALVPFPHDKTRALGLVAGDAPAEILQLKQKMKSVFVPTAPHPVSGFLLLYHEDDIKNLDIKTDDLFKFLISCGIYEFDQEKNPWHDDTKK